MSYDPPLLSPHERLVEAARLTEIEVADSIWWMEHYRTTGRKPLPSRVSRYLDKVKWLSRWREELSQC